jgi:hypothetical protein
MVTVDASTTPPGKAAIVDVVGEVDHGAFGVHPEGCGDEFGIHCADQVDQAGGAEHPR